MAVWHAMQKLVLHGRDLEIAGIEQQLEAIRQERRLLEEHNPLQTLRQQLLSLLRKALKEQHEAYKACYEESLQALQRNPEWARLTPAQQKQILSDHGVACVPDIETGDEAALLASLEEISLADWRTRTQALPQQFAAAQLAAARLLEPKTQTVRLASKTLHTAEEVKTWLQETEKELMKKIKDGPVLIT